MKSIQIIRSLFLLILVTTFMSSCGDTPEKAPAESVSKEEGIVLNEAQVKNAGLEFGRIEDKLLSSDFPARGKLKLPPGNHAFVTCLYEGVVSKILVIPGQNVRKGETLAYLRGSGLLLLQEEYLSAVSKRRFLELDYERQKSLMDEGINATKTFQKAKSEYEVAVAKEESLAARLEQSGISTDKLRTEGVSESIAMKSPITGKVEQVFAMIGTRVSMDKPLFEIMDSRELFLEIAVFEKDIMAVKPGQRVSFTLGNLGEKEYEAKILSVGSSVDDQARIVNVIASFQNEEGLLPGMFASAKIHAGEKSFPSLPEEAIIVRSEDEQYIYYTLEGVSAGGERNEPKEGEGAIRFYETMVNTGFREDGWVQVSFENPPPQGAMIVVKGAYYIWAEMQKENEE